LRRESVVLLAFATAAAAFRAPASSLAPSRGAIATPVAPLLSECRRVPPASLSAAVALPADYELPVPNTNNKLLRTLVGAYFALLAAVVVMAMYPPLVVPAWIIGCIFNNKQRRFSDFVVQWWARTSMFLFGASVTVEGAENLPPAGEPVMYTPNHCSFLDIFVLSGYMPRRFKYISKIEILRIPLIGWAMGFAKHIAISRMDRASQLKTLKDAIETLKSGNSLVTFPEGTRSKDGRIADFKKGPFTMASRAGVRIVPLTIVGTHLFQPPGAFVPLAIPRGVRIVIHPPLDAPKEKMEGESLVAAREAIISALPPSMRPLPAATE